MKDSNELKRENHDLARKWSNHSRTGPTTHVVALYRLITCTDVGQMAARLHDQIAHQHGHLQ